jgi:teichuronic acid biosynthesis glycosyltransferase TuaG
MPDISIITPYRNAARFLPELVNTLLEQSYSNWECLLVDDNSDDHGPALLAELTAADGRFRLLSMPPLSRSEQQQRLPARPRNLALTQASSPFIAFLDVDDLWHPYKLERQLAFHRAVNLDISVTAYGRFKQLDKPVDALRCPPAQFTMRRLQRNNPIPLLSVLIRKDLLTCGFTNTHHEDYLQWLNLCRDQPQLRYGCLNEVLACYQLHGENLTCRRPALMAWTYRVFRLHGLTRRQGLQQSLRWGISQCSTLVRERLRQHRSMPTASELLGQMPPRLIQVS